MILQLIRRDPAWRAIPYAMVAALFRGLVFGGNKDEFVMAFSSPLIVIAALLIAGYQLSSTPFLSPLPISVRDVYSARVLSVSLLFLMTLATGAPWIHGIAPVEFMAAASLLALIAQSVVMNRQSGFRAWMFGVCFLAGALMPMIRLWMPEWVEGRLGAAVAVGCPLVGACIFLWRWSTLPGSFQMAPAGVQACSPPSSRGTWRWPLIIYQWQYGLLCGVLLMQTVQAGFLMVPFVAFGVIGLVQSRHWIFTLPVSRHRLLAMWLTPVLLTGIAGCAGRSFIPWWSGNEIRVVWISRSVRAPLEIWRLVGSGSAPVMQAPWGETIKPAVVEVYGLAAYNPYEAGVGNSERFLDWQRARAKSAIELPEVRVRILESESILVPGLAILSVAAVLTSSWKPMRRLAAWMRWTPALVFFCGWMATMLGPIFGSPWSVRDLLVRLQWSLPHTWAVAAMIPVVLLYMAADRLFREGEFVDQTRPAKAL